MVSIKNTVPLSVVSMSPKFASVLSSKRDVNNNTIMGDKPVALSENHITTLTYQPGNSLNRVSRSVEQPIEIKFPDLGASFDETVHREQNRLVCALLTNAGYLIDSKCGSVPSRELMNYASHYLLNDKYGAARKVMLARLLLQPLGEYGSGKDEEISAARQQSVIAEWMQYATFNMSFYDWILSFITDTDQEDAAVFDHTILQGMLFNELGNGSFLGRLDSQSQKYYKEHVLSYLMPTYLLQPESSSEHKKLEEMRINQPEWGYLHAGTMLLRESGVDLSSMTLDDMITVGVMLEKLLCEGTVPADYVHYFKLPAMIYNHLKNNQIKNTSTTNTLKNSVMSYHVYFDYLREYSQHNPFVQLSGLLKAWKTRPVLARKELISKNVPDHWLRDYLYQRRDVKYLNKQGNLVSLSNIDKLFDKQNEQVVSTFRQVDALLLSQAFNALKEDEQQFIQRADIHRVKAEFNARSTVRGVFLPPSTIQGMISTSGLAVQVPDSLEILKCVINGEERIYALKVEVGTGIYKVYRIDYEKRLLLDLFPNDSRIRNDHDYKLRFHSPILLKKGENSSQTFINKLSTSHGNKLMKTLLEEGYQKTTRQQVDEFLLSLIPFYSAVMEAREGNISEAIAAGLIDMFNFLPFMGQMAYLGGRFSLAMGKAATQAFFIGLKQATIRLAFKAGAEQFIRTGVPYMAKSITPKMYTGLGVTLLRSADPGFELLFSGGTKGINALKNGVMALTKSNSRFALLVKALQKQEKILMTTIVMPPEVDTAFLVGSTTELMVVKSGRQHGRDLWVQINPETGNRFGRRYIRNAAGDLKLAPVPINGQFYTPQIEIMDSDASTMAKLTELNRLINNRRGTAAINLSNSDYSDIDFSDYFGDKVIDLSQANLENSNLNRSRLAGINLIGATLNKTKLSEALLVKANLSKAYLNETNLSYANLMHTNLSQAILSGANLKEATLIRSNLNETQIVFSDLQYADLAQANLSKTILIGSKFNNANLVGTDLTDGDLSLANFSQVNLSNAKLIRSVCMDTDFFRAILINSDFTNANLEQSLLLLVDLTGANLTGANLAKSYLSSSNFTQANLRDANLTGVRLSNTNFRGANLSNAVLEKVYINNTNFSGAIFTGNEKFTLTFPDTWEEDNLHLLLHHTGGNEGSMLTSIDSIDDRYSELKISLALQVIRSLEKSGADLSNVMLSLLAVFGKYPFTTNLEINLSLDRLANDYFRFLNVNLNSQEAVSVMPTLPLKTTLMSLPNSAKKFRMALIGRERGHDIWMQVNPDTGAYFGRQYTQNEEGITALAPTLTNVRFDSTRIPEISEERTVEVNVAGMGEGVMLEGGKQVPQSSVVAQLKKLKNQLANRMVTTVIDLSGSDFSGINFVEYFDKKVINLSLANLKNANFNGANLSMICLNKADLTEATLKQANLTGASLMRVNLNKANLSEAILSKANLMHANLSKATLNEANLDGAILIGSTLDEIHMEYGNLSHANLNKSSLKTAILSNAKLIEAELTEADLTGANLLLADLKGATLLGTKLVGSNLSYADLSNARLVNSQLEKADLTFATLKSTILNHVDFTEAKLLLANLTGAHLTSANLTRANLTSADLIDSNLLRTNLTNAKLAGADLTNAKLTGANFSGANLCDAVLNNVHIDNTNFAGASFVGNETFTLALPDTWDEDELYLTFHDFNNQGSLLSSIDSIDDRYSELKVQLVIQVVRSLERSDADFTHVTLPLLDVFGKALFIKNPEINAFVEKLIDSYLKVHSLNTFAVLKEHSTIINLFLNYFEKDEAKMVSRELNSLFIETILAARSLNLDVLGAVERQQQAQRLYEKYLDLPTIQAQLRYEQIKNNFGDYNGKPDWSDSYTYNYLLLSPVIEGRVMLVSEEGLLHMLQPSLETKWNNVFHFQNGNNLGPTELNLKECYTETFPLFAIHFSNNLSEMRFSNIIANLNLGDHLEPLFLMALKYRSYSTKLVSDVYQQQLGSAFSRVLNFENGVLKEQHTLNDQHYEKIIDLYDLNSSTNREKAEHLLSLSAVFTRYSSAAVFGTEDNSPLMLRYYAYALLEKAHIIDPSLIEPSVFDDWKNRLLGKEGAFCCTAILSDFIFSYIEERCENTLQKIRPVAWS